jgi:cell division septation protein DedD
MLIALPLIVTMAVGLIVGIRLVSEKDATLRLSNSGQGAANSTPASPVTSPPASPSPSATPSPTAAATVTPIPTATATATNMSCVRSARPEPGSRPADAARCAGISVGRTAALRGV